ncbi:Uncharacterised protein [Mycobacteroides abscessus subsp. abscessus]|nr:Uncharacterised protein [Mycobacteroides abscessus subsp. abscessus]
MGQGKRKELGVDGDTELLEQFLEAAHDELLAVVSRGLTGSTQASRT